MTKPQTTPSTSPHEAANDAQAAIESVQHSQTTGRDLGVGYVGTMSPEQSTAEEARLHAIVNSETDKDYRPSVSVPMGRDPNADVSMLEDDSPLPLASRVGFRAVEHPRARMASAMHDQLRGRAPSDLTADELSAVAEKVGLQVEGTGASGAPLTSDFVQAMDALAGAHPPRPAA